MPYLTSINTEILTECCLTELMNGKTHQRKHWRVAEECKLFCFYSFFIEFLLRELIQRNLVRKRQYVSVMALSFVWLRNKQLKPYILFVSGAEWHEICFILNNFIFFFSANRFCILPLAKALVQRASHSVWWQFHWIFSVSSIWT